MEFAENNRISHRQLYRQMILGFLAPFWLCMSGRGKLNGVDAVIGTVIAVVLLCFYVVFLIRLAPAFEDLKKTAGAFMGRVTGAFFLLFILLAGGYLLTLLQEVVPISLITGISGRWIAFWAILTCAVGAHKGMQRRGRIAEVSGGLLLAGILLMMVLCIPQGKAAYLEEMVQSWNFSGEKILWSGYGVVCAFSAVGLLPFLLGNVEKYGSAGKSVMFGIITLGGILAGMEILLPAVLGYGRVQAERYPVLPLLDGADLPGNVLARFDVLWLGFLLYSLLFALGSLLLPEGTSGKRAVLDTGSDLSDFTDRGKWKGNHGLFWMVSGICFCSRASALSDVSVFPGKRAAQEKSCGCNFHDVVLYVVSGWMCFCCGAGETDVSAGVRGGCFGRGNLCNLWNAGSFPEYRAEKE